MDIAYIFIIYLLIYETSNEFYQPPETLSTDLLTRSYQEDIFNMHLSGADKAYICDFVIYGFRDYIPTSKKDSHTYDLLADKLAVDPTFKIGYMHRQIRDYFRSSWASYNDEYSLFLENSAPNLFEDINYNIRHLLLNDKTCKAKISSIYRPNQLFFEIVSPLRETYPTEFEESLAALLSYIKLKLEESLLCLRNNVIFILYSASSTRRFDWNKFVGSCGANVSP